MCTTRPTTPCFLRPSSRASSVSDSFISLSGKHTEPRSYDQFMTTFICAQLPVKNQLCLDTGSDSESSVQFPFVNAVPIDGKSKPTKKCTKNKAHLHSIRSKHLIPSTSLILAEILNPPPIKSREARTNYLYYKGKQWCEVNKALLVDQKYPKPDPNHVRKGYSDTHQEAIKLTRKEQNLISVPSAENKELPPNVSNTAKELSLGDSETALSDRLRDIFAEITPIPEPSGNIEPWQFRAMKTDEVRHKKPKSKKRFWRKNIYPPKSYAEVIQERRRQLPPPKPDHLQTDYLSGIWEPELMINDFHITGFSYDSRILPKDKDKPDCTINWHELQEIKIKCNDWLDKCVGFL